jgi:hypothetical protein
VLFRDKGKKSESPCASAVSSVIHTKLFSD